MIPDTYFKAHMVEFYRQSEGCLESFTQNPEKVYKFLKGMDFGGLAWLLTDLTL